jgi:hypothetical protein
MVKYQGEDITFQINSNKTDLSFLTKFKIYFYTDNCFKSKFSKDNEGDGFNWLTTFSNGNAGYSGIIPSTDTSKMRGLLRYEIIAESSSFGIENETVIKKGLTGIFIEKSTIKQEAT